MIQTIPQRKYDIDKIKRDFNRVIEYSQNLSGTVNSDDLFENWENNKSRFINAWDGELIKELGEISFHLSSEQREKAVSNVIDQIEYLYDSNRPQLRFDLLSTFILDNQDTFFDNVVSKEKSYDGIKIPKGMKILKAFKFFCQDKDLLNDIQSIASMAIQNDKVSGILCMSVHPLDYLSSSENVHNWRSCHALDGEYRAGNLNYMGDSTTVVCYLKSTHKAVLPRFPEDIKWNSKKWRVLLFFDQLDSFIMVGRQYPFFENSLLLPIKKEVERMLDANFSGWFDEYIEDAKIKPFLPDAEDYGYIHSYEFTFVDKYLPVGRRILKLKNFVIDGDNTLQFNDLLESSSYTHPYYSFRLMKSGWNDYVFHIPTETVGIPKIRVGKACKCLECNDDLITMSDSMLCKHCMIKENQTTDPDEFTVCSNCGQVFVVDEGCFAYNQYNLNQPYCPECTEAYIVQCANCHDNYYYTMLNSDGLCPYCT